MSKSGRKIWILPGMVALALCFALRAFAFQPENVIPVIVGGSPYPSLNMPTITVKFCVPGTSQCQVVSGLELDTGSVGIRVFRSSLGNLSLPPVKLEDGALLTECFGFGGGQSDWGSVRKADVYFGPRLVAKSIAIQVSDPSFPFFAGHCQGAQDSAPLSGNNGVVGISVGLLDCETSDACLKNTAYDGSYFACSSQGCTRHAPPTLDEVVGNPLAKIDGGINGYVLEFPPVSSVGARTVTGSLILGIGTAANNQVQGQVTPIATDESGWMKLGWNGKEYDSLFDTGTYGYDFPGGAPFPYCQPNSSDLCPVQPSQVPVLVEDIHGGVKKPWTLLIETRANEVAGAEAAGNIGEQWGGDTSGTFILGMPFFYGRRVYFGIEGARSPLGVGPLVGF